MPLVNLAVALLLSGLVVIAIGANPIDALNSLLFGAVGYPEAIGFTLYYATNFIFTGLSVAVAFHAGLFNIGGEGQAYIGGLGVGLVCLALDQWPLVLVFPHRGRGGGAVRRRLGLHSRLSAGQARQPHRHHDDHVQLHRLGADDLSAGRRARAAGPAGAAQPRLRARASGCPMRRT